MDVRNPAPSEGRENGATVCTQASAGDDVPLKECDEMATECVSVFAWPARGKHLQLSVGMYTAMRNGQMSPVAKNNSEVWCGLKVGSLECVCLSLLAAALILLVSMEIVRLVVGGWDEMAGPNKRVA